MAYGYYQQSGMPGWGTNQFQFGAPPTPNFQPQPTWGGTDFYRAHASTSDPYLFDHAWNRVREHGGAPAGGMGVGLDEARHWHRRAYGGLNEIGLMQPHEIGHAAAYEAYRTWIHNSSIYEPLSGDIERQREALTGIAVAEASRLLQYSSRPMDNYAHLAASEAAAHTASYIFYQSRDGEYRSRSRSRSRSQYRQSFDDPYAFDDALFSPPRSRSAHLHRSRSRHGSFSQSGGIPFSGHAYSSSSIGQTPFPGQPGSYSSYSSQSGGIPIPAPYPTHGVPGSSYGSMHMGMGISPSYSASFPMDVASSYHGGSTLGAAMDYPRSRSSSFSYPQQGYPLQGYPHQGYSQNVYPQQVYSQGAYSQQVYPPYVGSTSSVGVPVAPGPTTIIIHKKKRKHRKRSRSWDPEYRSSSRY